MSILRDLAHRGRLSDLVFVHCARTRADVIFRRSVEALATSHPGLEVALFLDDAPAGGFDPGRLAARVPDFADRDTWLCGPPGLASRVERMWAEAGASARLRLERFVPPATPATGDRAADLQVTLARSNRSFAATSAATLLDQLERAGERPASGCRLGICHTCVCRKVHGTVENLLTGVVSSQPDEEIQPCVSVPRSDLTLAL
jgi:ferredoxin-NADP reductase